MVADANVRIHSRQPVKRAGPSATVAFSRLIGVSGVSSECAMSNVYLESAKLRFTTRNRCTLYEEARAQGQKEVKSKKRRIHQLSYTTRVTLSEQRLNHFRVMLACIT